MEKGYYNGQDCLNLIKHVINLLKIDGFNGFCVGNIIKYLYRYPHKNGTEDLKKAKDYIDLLFSDFDGCKYNKINRLDYLKEQINERFENNVFSYNQRLLFMYFFDALVYYGNNPLYYDNRCELNHNLSYLIEGGSC